MKRIFALVTVFIIMASGCKNNPREEYTILGEFTPSVFMPEILNGKVKKMTEKYFKATPDGDTVRKGNQITSKEADSLGWGNAYEVTFDQEGDLISCNYFNENSKPIGGAQLFSKNNRLDSLFNNINDTIKQYIKFKCDGAGRWIECKIYDAKMDTLQSSFTKRINNAEDTIEYKLFNNKGGLDGKMLFLYNDKKQIITYESYDMNDVFQGSTNFTYNDKGKLLTATYFDQDKKISFFFKRSYEYDSKGNWIKATGINPSGPGTIHERTFTYFE